MNLMKIFDKEVEELKDIDPQQLKTIKDDIFADPQSQVLSVDITLDEPRKSVVHPEVEGAVSEHLGV
jgi:hypothetical protein